MPVCVESCIAGAIRIYDLYKDYPSEYQSLYKEFSMKTITNPSTRFKYEKEKKTRFWTAESEERNETINI